MQRIWWRSGIISGAFLLCMGAAEAQPVFGVAGVPKSVGMLRDHKRIFDTLKTAGASVFLPTFQYVEQPAAKSLGFEGDFFPPCTASSSAFAALRQAGVQLVVSADVIYPRDRPLPALANDPLKTMIDCAGRANIYGVLSYDEPVHQGVKEAEVERVYDRVKAIDSSLPVLMVHAPMIADQPKYATETARANYLTAVLRYSRYADMVGFDVYPIPRGLSQITPPDAKGALTDPPMSISGYMGWLKRQLPTKRLMMVLQGFALRDQFEPNYLKGMTDTATINAMAGPSDAEMTQMTQAAISGGADLVFWWGPSLLGSTSDKSWTAIANAISASKAATANAVSK